MTFSASSRSVPLSRSRTMQSALRMLFPKVLGLRFASRSLIYSLGDGTISASFAIMVPENLCDFLPVLRLVWSFRICSKRAWPSRLLQPEMKIRLRSLAFGRLTTILLGTLFVV